MKKKNIDTFLLNRFQIWANWIYKAVGVDSFMAARICIGLYILMEAPVISIAPISLKTKIIFFLGEVGVPTLLCVHCVERMERIFKSENNQPTMFSLVFILFRWFILFWAFGSLFNITFTLLVWPNNLAIWLMYASSPLSLLAAVYFASCTPGPKQKSKFKKWKESFIEGGITKSHLAHI